jgi:hypothetical protein
MLIRVYSGSNELRGRKIERIEMRNVRWHVCKKVLYPVIAYGWEGAKRHNHIIYFLEIGFGVLRLVPVLGLALSLDVG